MIRVTPDGSRHQNVDPQDIPLGRELSSLKFASTLSAIGKQVNVGSAHRHTPRTHRRSRKYQRAKRSWGECLRPSTGLGA